MEIKESVINLWQLCASDTSVEGCKDKCGGVGCDHCGDQFGCTEAAVQKAKHALQMARDVQEIVREKQARATHMRDDIETARSQANQAHTVRIFITSKHF